MTALREITKVKPSRLLDAISGRLRTVRAYPSWSVVALRERWREAGGGHSVEAAHGPHLDEAVEWLIRAQDATPDQGFARGYSLTWNRYFGGRGWQPSYPETTGYIIPTFYGAATMLQRPELASRATRAAEWEVEIQLASGAVRGGVIGQPESPAIFNTGQVMFGWLAAYKITGAEEFGRAADRAARYLVKVQDGDGHWRAGNSKFARDDATLYNARVAWALAEVGAHFGESAYLEGARRNLEAVARQQDPNGWFPRCCLTDPDRPLLHTIAYTIRGLLEGGRVLNSEQLLEAAARASRVLRHSVGPSGWMPGRYNRDWEAAVSWSCLTGQAQMANNWMRLHACTGATEWLEPVSRVLSFLKSTQNRVTSNGGLRGGIKGSFPVSGEYGTYQLLNWATKYFVDAMLRDAQIQSGSGLTPDVHSLA